MNIFTRLFSRRTNKKTARQATTTKRNIICPEQCAKDYIDRIQYIMESDAALQDHWDRTIGSYFPLSVDNDMNTWVFGQVFYATVLPCSMTGNTADEYYHISHSRYALLDFSIYAYFSMRIMLCKCARREDVERADNLYFNLLVRYFQRNFVMSSTEINAIIDNRLQTYERIKRITPASQTEEELVRTLADFIAKDFDSTPLDNTVIIVSADKTYRLCNEICALMEHFYKLCARHLPSFVE